MRLVFSTSDFVYASRPRAGFPLILDDALLPAQPFHGYLHHRLLETGKLLDAKTWEAYGRRVWDFACFLHANGLTWDQAKRSNGASVVRIYRDWQAFDLKLSPSTINDRLEIVTDMYRWALRSGLIDRLPFTCSDVEVRAIDHDLAHVTGGRKLFSRADVMLREWEDEPAFLMASELMAARAALRSSSQRLLFDLMARVGLRSVEARTFPRTYVFDPASARGSRPDSLIAVRLDPRDMEIKFDKPRVVHVPRSLMEDMYAYTSFERNRFFRPDCDPKELILTTYGRPYSKGSAVKVFGELGKKIGFPVRPLMLRHSYAVHTLLLLRSRPELKLEPLMYVRDRLGHRSVQQTMVYLSQIERLLGSEALAMMDEFDKLYAVPASLSGASH